MSAGEWTRAAGDVLAHHWRVNQPSGRCSCGHEVPLGRSYPEHQAEALAGLVAERERAAQARALREAADALHDPGCLGCTGDGEMVVMARWIRERAAQIEAGGHR